MRYHEELGRLIKHKKILRIVKAQRIRYWANGSVKEKEKMVGWSEVGFRTPRIKLGSRPKPTPVCNTS